MAPQTYAEVPPWPGDSESTVLDNIEKVKFTFDHAPKALEKLNMLKNDILGNSAKAEQLAADWSELQQTLSNEPANDITFVRGGLDAYWTGTAKDSFNTYAIGAVATLNKDSGTFKGMANALGGCARIVWSTYSDAVAIVGKLASDLVGLLGDNKLKLIAGLLQTFIDATTDLISRSVDLIGQYKQQLVSFMTEKDGLQSIARPNPAAKEFDQWDVRSVT